MGDGGHFRLLHLQADDVAILVFPEFIGVEKGGMGVGEDIVDGEPLIVASAIEDEDVWRRLENYGKSEVWVTAIIPFLIPITAAFIILVTVGFPLFIL